MILFRPLIRYADFKGRASRSEYWLFAILQGFLYALLSGLASIAMGQAEPGQANPGLSGVFVLMGLTVVALIVPNYAVLVRRLHDSGRGAIWLCLMIPSVLCSVMIIGTIATAAGSVGLGAGREVFVGLALAGLGAAGLLGLLGLICQAVLVVLTLMPGTRGENRFGPDPRDPTSRYGADSGGSTYDEARLDRLFAEAKRARSEAEPYRPVFDFGPGPSVQAPRDRNVAGWPTEPPSGPSRSAPTFGRRGA